MGRGMSYYRRCLKNTETVMDFDPDTHPVRITTGGKIKTWVQFALDFLDVRRFLLKCFSCSILAE